MKLVLLDIDGVCNNNHTRLTTSDGWCFVDDELVQKVKQIIDATGAKIVLSSSWREGWCKEDERKNEVSFNELRHKFAEFGMKFYDRTGESRGYRGMEIQEYLDAHEDDNIESFVIIDDWPDMMQWTGRLVKTKSSVGITDDDVTAAIKMLDRPYTGGSEPLYLGDLLHNHTDCFITYRARYPVDLNNVLTEPEKEWGLSLGWCKYKDGKLLDGEGGPFSMKDVLEKYTIDFRTGDIVVWTNVDWGD